MPNLKTTTVTWWTQNKFKNVVKIYFPVAKQEYPTEFEKEMRINVSRYILQQKHSGSS